MQVLLRKLLITCLILLLAWNPALAQSPGSLAGSTAFTARAWKQGGVVSYPQTKTSSLPALEQLQADLPRIRQLLAVARLRFYAPLTQLPALSGQLLSLTALARRAGFKTELVISGLDQFKATRPEDLPDLAMLRQADLTAIYLKAPETAAGRLRFKALYASLKSERGILFRLPAQLAWLQTQVPAPDRWLYRYNAPIAAMHARIQRIDALLGKVPWQLERFAVPETGVSGHEYAQAWLHRFAFYFSKKYGLDPAAVVLHDSDREGFQPGLLRADGSLRPAFWLAQIYYHVRRIDLDEPKLTAALYEPPQSQSDFPIEPEAFLRRFLETLYKLRAEESVTAYLAAHNSALFYDFLELRSEESLLNSHFARLETISLQAVSGQTLTWKTKLGFVSALGSFSFDQMVVLEPDNGSWRIRSLGEPQLRPDYQQDQLNQLSHAQIEQNISPELKTTIKVFESTPSEKLLAFRVVNQSRQALDLQPIALTGQGDGKIYMPAPAEAVLYRQLAPGEAVSGLIRFGGDQPWQLKIQTLPSEPYAPRALLVRPVLAGGRLELDVTNPQIERLLLPIIRVRLDDSLTQKQYTLRYVLPQALLPLERRHYSLPLPPGFRGTVEAIGNSYPIVDLEINLDDAWRSKLLGHWPQALFKYREILRRFGANLPPERRVRVLQEQIWLEFWLGQLATARQSLRGLSEVKGVPLRLLAQIDYELAQMLLAANLLPDALDLVRQARRLNPARIDLLRLQGHLFLRLAQPGPALQSFLQLLARAPDDTETLKTVSGLYQRLGRWQAALIPLLHLQTLSPRREQMRTIASLYQRLKQLQPALDWYLAYSRAGGKDAAGDIGWLYERLGQPALALQWYRRALSQSGNHVELRLTIAWLERRLGQPQAALTDFGAYLAACSPCRSQVFADAGFLAKELGQPELAISYYARHLALTGNAGSRRSLAALYQQRGQYPQALQTLRPLAAGCRDCRSLWLELAYLSQKQGRWAEALGWYRRTGPLQGLPYTLRYDLAFGALRAGDAGLAQELLQGLLTQASPVQERALRRELAGLYRRQGQPQQALAVLEAYSQAPDAVLFEDLLATALEAGQPGRLNSKIQALAQRPPAGLSPVGHYLLGKWAYATGDYVTATTQLQIAIAASPRLIGEYYRLLAAAYKALGQSDCAIAWLERADRLIAHKSGSPLPPGCR